MEERIGSDFSDDNVRAASEGLGATLDPPGDVHASGEYRRHLAEVLAARAVIAARERR
jgi:carbon-monoxide dehydrogenase medium subunit